MPLFFFSPAWMTKICRYEAHKLKGKNSRNGNYAAIFIAKHLIRVTYGRSAAITAVTWRCSADVRGPWRGLSTPHRPALRSGCHRGAGIAAAEAQEQAGEGRAASREAERGPALCITRAAAESLFTPVLYLLTGCMKIGYFYL